jgi:hypothetical protein
MFSAHKYFKSKNLYIIIEKVYYKDAEPKVPINIIIKRKEYIYLNIFEGGLGQKCETKLEWLSFGYAM